MKASRVGIIVVLIVSLVGAGFTRDWALRLRNRGVEPGQVTDDTSSLANMNSFALALLLGGLRGPLVMFLWIQSENQKNDRDLEDFDTYVEWIRLLQPEFDTVHIFQVWNKAYNISVQMASWANKYTAILDALEYAHKVLAERPNDINMVYAIASIYFDKLGNSAEKAYYKKRVREESLPHESRQRLPKTDPSWRRLDLDPVLDARGYILPKLLKPKYTRPSGLPAGEAWNNGAELQFLAPYQPFPLGVSTFAFAYNYHKQADILQEVGKQRHANLADLVIDSRPALALKGWSEDEWERGRRFEMQAFNVSVPDERRDMEMKTANIAVDTPFSERSVIDDAIYSYNLGARLSSDALVEYNRHLRKYTQNFSIYQLHMDSMRAQGPLMLGDRDYLKAMLAKGDARKVLLTSAAAHYRDSLEGNLLIILKYYSGDQSMQEKCLPAGINRYEINKLTLAQREHAYATLLTLLPPPQMDGDAEDRSDYQRYVDRAHARLARIQKEIK